MKDNRQSFKIIILVSILLFVSIVSVYSSEDGKSIHLDLVESYPSNGEESVDNDVLIHLLFNKNVVNMSVKDNNANCFKLLDDNQEEVPIEILFPDDQIEPERKRQIDIKPIDTLEENKSYSLEISSELKAKNGMSLDKVVTISFTTKALEENTSSTSTEDIENDNISSTVIASEEKESLNKENISENSSDEAAKQNEASDTESEENNKDSNEENTKDNSNEEKSENSSNEDNNITIEKEDSNNNPSDNLEDSKEEPSINTVYLLLPIVALGIVLAIAKVKSKKRNS